MDINKSTFVEQVLNLRVQVHKRRHAVRRSNTQIDTFDIQESLLTDYEYLSHVEDIETFRELPGGLTEAYLNYDALRESEPKGNYKKILELKLQESIDFEKITYTELSNKLCMKSREKIYRSDHKVYPIKKMPIVRSIKKLGSGTYGTAFIIKKWNENKKFQLENEERKNTKYYVLKSCFKNFDRHKSPSYISSVYNEIDFNYCLFHPNIAEFFGAYYTHKHMIFISEFLCYPQFLKTLFLKPNAPLRPNATTIQFIGAQILMALEFLHLNSILYMDLHNGNICADQWGYVKLIDLGLANYNNANIEDCFFHKETTFRVPKNYRANHKERFQYDIGSLGKILNDLQKESTTAPLKYQREFIYQCMNGFDGECKIKVGENMKSFKEFERFNATDLILNTTYFKTVDFKRLLCRDYDLEQVYRIKLKDLSDIYYAALFSEWNEKHDQTMINNRQITHSLNKRQAESYKKREGYDAFPGD